MLMGRQNYLLRWIEVKPNETISWTIQPHKKSINFGIFKHLGHIAGVLPNQSSTISLPLASPNPELLEPSKDAPKENASTVADKLTSIGLKQVFWVGRYEADKMSQGKYEVLAGDGGHFALVFDNTFSKSFSKNVTFFLLTYSTKYPPRFGAQIHHSQAGPAMATVFAPSQSSKSVSPRLRANSSPRLRAVTKDSVDSLKQAFAQHAASAVIPAVPEVALAAEPKAMIFTGVLQKRRRKKHQGYARRFFSLDFTSSTLSYYHDRNSSALRGAIPLSLAAIGANAKTREISIDSGAEIWHLRANNVSDFDEWKRALHRASTLLAEAKSPGNALDLQTEFYTPGPGNYADEQDWARLEGLLSRISGIRDAVRRLCIETESKAIPPPSSGPESGPNTPIEEVGDDYFRPSAERKSFWKRKASAPNAGPSIFKRSSSTQLAVPSPEADQTSNGRALSPIRSPISTQQLHSHGGEGMHKHCKAMLHDLDSVVSEFSLAVADRRQSRLLVPTSALSRMSLQSVDSQEYFDAEDQNGSAFLNINEQSDSEEEQRTDETVIGDTESATSSDIDDDDGYTGSRKAFKPGSLSSLLPAKAKTLTPLPKEPVKRRLTVASPTIMPPSLIGFLRKNVGKDLSTITMPVSANEPTSLLQRASEQLEYSSLLDRAAAATDAVERLIYVTAFAVSGLSNARIKERSIRKPFNPMLGETFELVREDRGFRFIAEKVSHRPVQLAFQAESSTWSFAQNPLPSQKFWGKSSEIVTEGKARLILYPSDECLSWSTPTCFLRNIIAGDKYVEPVGTMTVLNETTGHKAIVTFKSKGMFSGRSEDVEVQAVDSHGGEVPLGLHGTWTDSLQLREHGSVTKTVIWSAGPLVDQPAKHYGMTLFAASLNEVTAMERDHLPPTDSRLRPDQKALEVGDHETAERLKNQLEEKQRERRKEMEGKGEEWKPRWFTRVENGDEVVWKMKSGKEGYWEERSKGAWTGVVPVLAT